MIDTHDLKLADFIAAHPRLLVLTGAGVSTASGLGDYRDKHGQWKRRQPITGQLFISDEAARKRYWARSAVGWPAFSRAEPGPAHHALRSLQISGHADRLITQNVDRLHQKAGHEDVTDLHGVLALVRCIACQHTVCRDTFQKQLIDTNEWLQHLSAAHAPDGDADLEIQDLANMVLPSCPQCGSILKPDVVFFGESVPKTVVADIMQHLTLVDALLVAGSSLMVYSGFRFCKEASRLGKPIVIINNGVTRADDLAHLKIEGDCGARLGSLVSSQMTAHR